MKLSELMSKSVITITDGKDIGHVSDAILTPMEKESKLVILDIEETIKSIVLPYQKEALKQFLNKKCIDLF